MIPGYLHVSYDRVIVTVNVCQMSVIIGDGIEIKVLGDLSGEGARPVHTAQIMNDASRENELQVQPFESGFGRLFAEDLQRLFCFFYAA